MNEARIVARESKPGSDRGGTPDETPRPSHTTRSRAAEFAAHVRLTLGADGTMADAMQSWAAMQDSQPQATPDRAAPPRYECVACGRPCPPHRRWCSAYCFYEEDGYPDDDWSEEDEADD